MRETSRPAFDFSRASANRLAIRTIRVNAVRTHLEAPTMPRVHRLAPPYHGFDRYRPAAEFSTVDGCLMSYLGRLAARGEILNFATDRQPTDDEQLARALMVLGDQFAGARIGVFRTRDGSVDAVAFYG